MRDKRGIYWGLILLSFVIGTQFNFKFKTSQVFTSDVIAIINNDQKVAYMNKTLKMGDVFLEQVENGDSRYKFQVTSSAEAEQGLVSGKYGATLTVPSDFTTSILSVNTEAPVSSSITYSLNSELLPSKRIKMEETIVNNINDFEDNITYMYMYSIFDSLHTTQAGLQVVGDNTKPVYEFIDDISEVDVVSNHQYELAANNKDAFSIIDISKQLTAFAQTVNSYKQQVANVIDVYKQQNEQFGTAVETNMEIVEENDGRLNDRVKNVEDTLETIVKDNEQYTDEQYSITDSKSQLEAIILLYLNQLKTVNNNYQQIQKIYQNENQLNQSLQTLNTDSYGQGLNQLADYRSTYYASLDQIVEQCLNLDKTAASVCVNNQLVNYQQQYQNYDDFKRQLADEQSYYQAMTYYLTNIDPSSDPGNNEIDTQFVNIPIEYPTSSVEKTPVDKPGDLQSVTISGENYSSNLTVTDQTANNMIELDIANLQNISELKIEITNKNNIKAIIPLATTEGTVTVNEDNIQIANIKSTRLNLRFNIELSNNKRSGQVEFKVNNQLQKYKIGPKQPLTATAVVKDSKQIIVDYNYVIQTANEQVKYQNSEIFKQYHQANIKLTSNPANIVTLNADGFTIDGSRLQIGDIVKFQITVDNLQGKPLTTESYTLTAEQFSFPVDFTNPTIITELEVADDPFTYEGNQVENKNDDEDRNQNIEVNEKIGFKYNVGLTSQLPISLNQVQFTTTGLDELTSDIYSTEVIVMNGDQKISATAEIIDQQINVNLMQTVQTELVDGQNQLGLDIYLNVRVKNAIANNGQKYQVSFDNFQLLGPEVEFNTSSIALVNFNVAIGDPQLTAVEYQVATGNCQGQPSLATCQFEAGTSLTKAITIENKSRFFAPALTLNDNLASSDLISKVESNYQFTNIKDGLEIAQGTLITAESSGQIQFSMPANSRLVITQTSQINTNVNTTSKFLNEISLHQFDDYSKGQGSGQITVMPIPITVVIKSDEQKLEDGVITPNETLKLEIELRNNSIQAIATDNYLQLSTADPNSISDINITSVEDQNWKTVAYTADGVGGITINQGLAPKQSISIKLRVNFNDLKTASSNQTFDICNYQATRGSGPAQSCDQVSYQLAIDPDYLQLAREQAATGVVLNNETYQTSLSKTNVFIKQVKNIKKLIQSLITAQAAANSETLALDLFTSQTNEQITQISDQISEFGLGYESRDDESNIAQYEYCRDNQELSCKLFNTYNQIMTKEAGAKQKLLTILNTIDPRIKEVLGTKPSEDQASQEPINIGGDFNGDSQCRQVTDENEQTSEVQACTTLNPGINERIKLQASNLDILDQSIKEILDNQTTEVDEKPYQQQLTQINEQTNQVMDQVESENNQLFDEKIDVYNQNYQKVMDYVSAISEDKTYQQLIKKFDSAEKNRQKETFSILENVSNLLPNTSLAGMPNKLVYAFIASPFISQQVTNVQTIVSTPDSRHKLEIIAVIILIVVSSLLFTILYFINRRGENGNQK